MPKVLLVLLALSFTSALAARTYTVQKGDTLTRIARQHGLTIDALLEANQNIQNISSLNIGQKITLPTPGKPTAKPTGKPQVTAAGLNRETWTWPLTGKITSGYGYRTLVVAGSNFHGGLDISAPQGTPIKAARSGTVVFAGFDPSGFGNTVVIDHGGGWQSRYSHNSQLLVQVGQQVQNGQAIALVGRTGYATGAHLDYRITFNGRELDPLKIH